MSGYSKVGTSGVYEAGDQRNVKQSELNQPDRYEEGQVNSHLANDSSMATLVSTFIATNLLRTSDTEDERSIANRLAAEEQKSEDSGDSKETKLLKKDATLPVS